MKKKFPFESYIESRKLVMPDQINPNKTLFGGVLMSWIDEAAYMTAQKHSGESYVVTVAFDQIVFHRPIHVGDQVILKSRMAYVGRSSMEIFVAVEKEDGATGAREYATHAFVTFVALDEANRPMTVPRLAVETVEERCIFNEGLIRQKIRSKVRRWSVNTKTYKLLTEVRPSRRDSPVELGTSETL